MHEPNQPDLGTIDRGVVHDHELLSHGSVRRTGLEQVEGRGLPQRHEGKCTITLSEINATVAVLINTCSYPSSQPNSDPSDCVLIPSDAFLKIVKDAGGDTQQAFSFSVSGGTTVTQNVLGSTASVDNSATIAIKSAVATSVTETLPNANWAFTSRRTALGGTNNGTATSNAAGPFGRTGVTAASDTTVTCTFTNALKAPPVITINKVCTPGAHAASDRFQPVDEAPTPDVNAGSELACNTGTTTYSPAADTAFSIREVAGSSGSLSNYTSSFSAGCTSATGLARGATGTCTITNTLKAGPVITINKVCTPGAHAASDRFQPVDEAPTPDVNAGSELACNTGTTTYSPAADTAFSIREVAGSSGSLSNYTSSFSAGCTSASGLARGATGTCTITNTLKAGPVITINKVCTPGAHAASDRFQPVDEAPTPDVNAGSELACNTGTTTYSPAADTAFSIREVAGSSGSLSNYTSSFSAGCTNASGLARGATGTCTITNTLRTFTVVTYVCEGGQLYASSVTFNGSTTHVAGAQRGAARHRDRGGSLLGHHGRPLPGHQERREHRRECDDHPVTTNRQSNNEEGPATTGPSSVSWHGRHSFGGCRFL